MLRCRNFCSFVAGFFLSLTGTISNVVLRFPIAVNLEKKDLKAEIDRCLNAVILPLSHHGNCSMVNVGHTDMKAEAIVANVMEASKILAKRYPGGWKNIRSIHVKAEKTLAIPAYISVGKFQGIIFV